MAAQQPSPRPPVLPPGVASRYVMVGDIRTHYLEAGEGEPLLLIHSAEFGGRAEFSWRYNIAALAERYHVYAPDIVGFGRSSMLCRWASSAGRSIATRPTRLGALTRAMKGPTSGRWMIPRAGPVVVHVRSCSTANPPVTATPTP